MYICSFSSWYLMKDLDTKVQEGPNKLLHINEFILEQILTDINVIIDYKKSGYDIQFNDKQKEIEKISEEIQQTKSNWGVHRLKNPKYKKMKKMN